MLKMFETVWRPGSPSLNLHLGNVVRCYQFFHCLEKLLYLPMVQIDNEMIV